MKLIRLTHPSGYPVELNAEDISELFPNDGTAAKAAKTIVAMVNGHQHAVKETMAEINRLLK